MTLSARMDPEVNIQNHRLARLAILLITSWALCLVAIILILSTFLRPIADDYVLGEAAGAGIVPAIVGWWSTWSGDLSLVIANTVLVGLPLQHLPWSVATAIPFVLSGLLVAGFGTWLAVASSIGIGKQVRPLWRLVLFVVAFVLWWAYWWVNFAVSGGAAYSSFLARGITFWQNLNSQYVITVTALAWAWLWLETRAGNNRVLLGAGSLLWGILAGMCGPVFAMSVASTLVFVLIFRIVQSGHVQRAWLWITGALGVILGAAVSHFSPGTQSRAQLVTPRSRDTGFVSAILNVTDDSVMDWWSGIFNPGSLVVLLIVGVVVCLTVRLGASFQANRAAILSVAFLSFALLVNVVNRLSELFTYEAWWHVITARTFTWFGLCMMGVWLGTTLSSRVRGPLLTPLLILGGFLGVLLTTSGIDMMADEVLTRVKLWEIGPAPLEGMSDIEEGGGWTSSWLALRESRGGPARGLGD